MGAAARFLRHLFLLRLLSFAALHGFFCQSEAAAFLSVQLI
jgi:hypothetical protein